jgi:hypothetical protein
MFILLTGSGCSILLIKSYASSDRNEGIQYRASRIIMNKLEIDSSSKGSEPIQNLVFDEFTAKHCIKYNPTTPYIYFRASIIPKLIKMGVLLSRYNLRCCIVW